MSQNTLFFRSLENSRKTKTKGDSVAAYDDDPSYANSGDEEALFDDSTTKHDVTTYSTVPTTPPFNMQEYNTQESSFNRPLTFNDWTLEEEDASRTSPMLLTSDTTTFRIIKDDLRQRLINEFVPRGVTLETISDIIDKHEKVYSSDDLYYQIVKELNSMLR